MTQVVVNVTSWSVGSNPEDLITSNTGWTKVTGTGLDSGTGLIRVTNSQSPNGAYPVTASSYGYIYNTEAGSKTQTVIMRMHRFTSATGPYMTAICRYVDANNWIGLQWSGDGSTFRYVKCIAGTRSFPGSYINVPSAMSANGDYVDCKLVVTYDGSSSATVAAFFSKNGGAYQAAASTTTLTDAEYSGVGKFGLWVYYTVGSTTQTAGQHAVQFYGEDASIPPVPPAGTVTISGVVATDTTAEVTFSYSDSDATGYEYRLDGGTAASLGSSPATISSLTPNTEYDLEVRATNAYGNGSWSSVTTFGTDNPISGGGSIGNGTTVANLHRINVGIGVGV